MKKFIPIGVLIIAAVLLIGCSALLPTAEQADESNQEGEEQSSIDNTSEDNSSENNSDENGTDAESNIETTNESSLQKTSRGTPADKDLNLRQRHPGGTLLEVNSLRFDGNSMIINAEFINGANSDVRILVSGGNGLRLQDNLGNTYNFVVPDGINNSIELEQGESVGGEFVFLGPVEPEAEELILIVNLYDPINLPFDPDSQFRGAKNPAFVIEGLELSW